MFSFFSPASGNSATGTASNSSGASPSAGADSTSNSAANNEATSEQKSSDSSDLAETKRQLKEAHDQIINLQNSLANALNQEGGSPQDKVNELENKLTLCKKELHDAVTKFRVMLSDVSKARDAEKATNAEILLKLEHLRNDMQDQAKHHDMEKIIWQQKYDQMQKACSDKEAVIESLKAKIRQYDEQRNRDFQNVLASHQAHKESASKEVGHVLKELDRMTKYRDDLQTQLNTSQEHNGRLEKIIQNLTSKYDESNRSYAAAKRELDSANASLKSTSDLNEQLKGQLLTARARLDEANQEISTLNRVNHDLREQHEGLRKDLTTQQRSTGAATESYQLQITSLEDQCGRLREEVQRLKGEKAALAQDINGIKADLAVEREAVTKAETARDAASASAASAAHQIEQLIKAQNIRDEDHRLEKDALMKKIEDLMGDISTKKEEISNFNRRFDKAIADKNMEIANLMTVQAAQNEAHKQEMTHMKDSLSRLQTLHDKVEFDLAHLRELDIANKATISQLEISLQQSRQRGDDLSRQNQESQNELAGLKAINQTLTGELSKFREESNKLRSNINDLERELKSLQALKNLSNQQLEQRCKDLQKQADDAGMALREQQSKLTAQKEAMTILQGEMEQSKLLVGRLEAEIGRLEGEKGEFTKQLAELRTQINTSTVKTNQTHTHTHTSSRQKLPHSVHEKIDNLNKQLKFLHNLSMSIQDEMVPEEHVEVSHTEGMTTNHSVSHEISQSSSTAHTNANGVTTTTSSSSSSSGGNKKPNDSGSIFKIF